MPLNSISFNMVLLAIEYHMTTVYDCVIWDNIIGLEDSRRF